MRPEPAASGSVESPPAVAPAGPMVPTLYRVTSRLVEVDETITLTIDPIDTAIAPPAAGQFNMLWAFGRGEAPISLAARSGDTLAHTIRRVGTVTSALCEAKPGDEIGVRGPFGIGWDLAGAAGRDVLVIAGGLGVVPVRPIISQVLAQREDYGRFAVLIGARSPSDLLYRQKLEQWRGRLDIELEVTVDSAPTSWRGDVGVVTRLVDRAPVNMADATVFICGPEIMMRFGAQAVLDQGADPGAVYVSLERNMHCAIGHCGHCQLGSTLLCKTGPVMPWAEAEPLLKVRAR